MRLLAQSEKLTFNERLKAESFAEWLLKVGEGRDNTVPLTEIPQGTIYHDSIFDKSINLFL